MVVCVLICTYNRGNLIDDTLRSLIECQEEKPDEIIVVNGGGANNCSQTLQFWKNQFPALREIETENVNLATGRNLGLSYCGGDLILQTDDDAQPFPDWIKLMKEAHETYPDAGVIGGEVVDSSGKSWVVKVADAITFPFYSQITEVRSLPGVNSSYKREIIRKVGDYDVSMFRGEDVDYNWRVLQAGWKVLYIPGIKVSHHHRSSWKGLLNQHYMYGRAYYRVRRKWPLMYSVYPRSVSTARDYLKLAYFLISPFHNAINRMKRIRGPFNKCTLFLPMIFVGYSWLWGYFTQMKKEQA